jgi:hypothetical protein
MGNILDKIYRENEKAHFVLDEFFPENGTFCEIMSKSWVETEGPQMTPERGVYALHAGLTRLHALMRTHTLTRSRTPMHAHTDQ